MREVVLAFLVQLATLGCASLLRLVRRTRFWSSVEQTARTNIADPTVPITDPREAAERALLEAQREQLDRIERAIRAGGNGMRPTPRPPTEPNGHDGPR